MRLGIYYSLLLGSMIRENSKIKFPFWQYLTQPVFSPYSTLVLNPCRFAYFYRVELLKRCWATEFDTQGETGGQGG